MSDLISSNDFLIPKKETKKSLTLPELEKLINEQNEKTMGFYTHIYGTIKRINLMNTAFAKYRAGEITGEELTGYLDYLREHVRPVTSQKVTIEMTKVNLTIEGEVLNG